MTNDAFSKTRKRKTLGEIHSVNCSMVYVALLPTLDSALKLLFPHKVSPYCVGHHMIKINMPIIVVATHDDYA